ncbi:exosortase F system-associated protein [Olleya aquimaris]|uniref:Exosortase F system-associated protein n=1 Tax=Olleya sediminilitoris TaxID=2795739 RepID=A0ABS1WJB7_9FLAO|nr:exosortase F system-associated protein [Olleya sediminilitoris]AXO81291.1 exosortase F system-associated protein [Olleya aquimaris]MBL7559215.1 exosortase F system-associated protein [Olleya sediminilitoris]
MKKYLKYIGITALFFLLALVRWFENDLFYDPYLLFFQNDYLYLDSPRQEVLKLVANTTLRFVINTMLSIAILYLFFKDKSVIKFASLVYVFSFVILIALFMFFVLNPKQENYYLFFNIRRFLIQPILLLLLLPAFYYNRLT